jgi:hypothetical protein
VWRISKQDIRPIDLDRIFVEVNTITAKYDKSCPGLYPSHPARHPVRLGDDFLFRQQRRWDQNDHYGTVFRIWGR